MSAKTKSTFDSARPVSYDKENGQGTGLPISRPQTKSQSNIESEIALIFGIGCLDKSEKKSLFAITCVRAFYCLRKLIAPRQFKVGEYLIGQRKKHKTLKRTS